MQARAIFEAALEVAAEGKAPLPEVMVPLVATRKELAIVRALIERTAEAVFAEKGARIDYLIGTMIELPRAALQAGSIAEEAQFFSFGTNDLTQTALGVSRDDAGRFLSAYVEQGIFARDPFVSIDVDGVGELISLAAERGRATRADLKLGICGEHGGDPASIAFCEGVRLDYVSASPYRVPIARLAAARDLGRRWSLTPRLGLPPAFIPGGGAAQRLKLVMLTAVARRLGFGLFAPLDLLTVAALPFRAGEERHAEDDAEHEDERDDQPLIGGEGGHAKRPLIRYAVRTGRPGSWFRLIARRARRR
jgi:hypothetical protein